MIKKTRRHKQYGQLASRLSVKLTLGANEVFARLLNLSTVVKAVYIASFRPRSDVISTRKSRLWETEAGNAWLRLLVFAVLYLFGLDCGVGADKLSRFFKLIRIDTHVGVSPSALRSQLNQMEVLLPQFQAACESQVKKRSRKVVVAMDETFFGEFLILVLMDLRSGYLLLEEISDDRRFETWYAKTAPRLESLGIEVNHAISDRAKALIKLALSGFECESGADAFHAQQDVSRWLGASGYPLKAGQFNVQ